MIDDKLWDIFSIYIRLRDSNAEGFGKCFTCGKWINWKDGDAGHGVNRQHMAVKYEEKNNHLQCGQCNAFHGGRQDLYEKEVNRRYGANTWDLLWLKSRQVCKWTRFEIDALAAHYANKIKELMKGKGFQLSEYYLKKINAVQKVSIK